MGRFIHIGMPKTATKTFQREYFSAHDSIRHVGKNKEDVPKWEVSLVDKIIDTERSEWRQVRDTIPNLVPNMTTEDVSVVVSAEAFGTGTLRAPKVDRFTIAERLGELYPDASIVVTIREQVDILQSIFLQRLEPVNVPNPGRRFSNYTCKAKFGGNIQTEFENWIDEMLNETDDISNELDYYDYSELVEIYRTFFDDIHVLVFEELKENPQRFVDQLSDILGIESKPSLIGQSNRNPRLTTAHLWWLKLTNLVPQAQGLLDVIPKEAIDHVRSHSTGLEIAPTDRQKRELRRRYAPGIGSYKTC